MLGGLALFLFALKLLSSGLQEAAGKKVNRVLEILTSVPLVGMLVGAVITIVVQSSTLTTVMVVSFVNSTILNLKQAAAVIMGANIGTTLTGHLVAFNITSIWIYCAFVGFIIYFFVKQKNIKNIGQILFAFALLLLGLSLMSDAMRPLRTHEGFRNLIETVSHNRLLGALVGIVFTAVVQSSTAVTGVIILMTMEELIGLDAALALIIGANIGTCFTAVLASLSGTTVAKRAAAVHVIINLFAGILLLIFMGPFRWMVLAISGTDVPRQAANAHTIISAVIIVVFLPLINQLVKFVELIIPERVKAVDAPEEKGTRYLDWKMTKNAPIALELAHKELLHMGELAGHNIRLSMEGLIERKKKKLKQMRRQERVVDSLEAEIVRYLAAVSSHNPLGKDMAISHAGLLHAANDIERISDHARNIARSAQHMVDEDLHLPESILREMEAMYKELLDIYNLTIRSVREKDASLVPQVRTIKVTLATKEEKIKSSHMELMENGDITYELGIIFLDIMSNLERIGDHSVNISHLPQGRL